MEYYVNNVIGICVAFLVISLSIFTVYCLFLIVIDTPPHEDTKCEVSK